MYIFSMSVHVFAAGYTCISGYQIPLSVETLIETTMNLVKIMYIYVHVLYMYIVYTCVD